MEMAGGWTGRDACALQSALRLSNQELAAHLGLGHRTVADWHAKPHMRPRPETQRILDTAFEQASPAVKDRFAVLTGRTGQQGSADEGKLRSTTRGGADTRSVMIGSDVSVASKGGGFEAPEFGRLLLPRMVGTREIRDPKSGTVTGMRTDASILYYLIEHFVRVGAIDVAINEGIYDGAIPTLPRMFRARLVEIDRADSTQSVLEICEPIARELRAVISSDGTEINRITYRSSMAVGIANALSALVFNLCDYIRGMRHGLIVTMDLPGMRTAIATLLELVSGMESRANLVTLEQVFSTYQLHEIGASVIKSSAPARMMEIFDDLITNPLYRQLSQHAANMGIATESAESAAAVTRTAKRLAERDDHLGFGQYRAFIASGRQRAIDDGPGEHFNSKYFPPIVPIGDAYAKAKAAWARADPAFIPIGPRSEGGKIGVLWAESTVTPES